MVSVIALLKFIWPGLDTAYIELPLLAIYNIVTFVHFFTDGPRWIVVLKSLFTLVALFLMAHYFEGLLMRVLS